MRTVQHPQRKDICLMAVLYALSDPIRLQIVVELACEGEKACGTFSMDSSKANLSHHFKVLREAGIVSVRMQGTHRLNSLRREDLEARFPGLLTSVLHSASSHA